MSSCELSAYSIFMHELLTVKMPHFIAHAVLQCASSDVSSDSFGSISLKYVFIDKAVEDFTGRCT